LAQLYAPVGAFRFLLIVPAGKAKSCFLDDAVSMVRIVASRLLEADWINLSANPSAIELIENNMNKVDLPGLSTNPAALHIIMKNLDKMDPHGLLMNPSIFTYNYHRIKTDQASISEEVMKHFYHPTKLKKWLMNNLDKDVLDYP